MVIISMYLKYEYEKCPTHLEIQHIVLYFLTKVL